ncbi:MAG: exodeoxyribonuclease III [Verrucomicrobiota bacterium]|jgi:exodeoxyribonuclease-3|nr:exodeoxyribonuclease III [Verrucomicrobiota bacterium]
MKIATFNCNSIRSRIGIVLDWLAAHSPDILCLQETKVQDEEFPAEAFNRQGWQVAYQGEKAYNGVALVSKKKADEVSVGLDEAPKDPARLIHARFGKLHVVNTYVPQGRDIESPMYAYKLHWFARLKAYMARRFTPVDRVLWCGDLNVARLPIDVSHPENKANHVCYHIAVRKALEEVLAFGFTDLFREQNPDLADYSFYDYRVPFDPENKHGWRIDYILATPPLAEKCTQAAIDIRARMLPKPSDHTPLYAVLKR